MFTGLIEEVGSVSVIQRTGNAVRLTINAKKILEDIKTGDSIAVNGICLTATDHGISSFSAEVMHETLDRTSLGRLRPGTPVNLERAMPANGRFGGHIVTGHIDGTGIISKIQKDHIAVWYTIQTSRQIAGYIVEKGSIAIDGISLTVAAADQNSFRVSVIPHTLQQTALAAKKVNDIVNLENDCIGKYIRRFLMPENKTQLSKELLLKHGF